MRVNTPSGADRRICAPSAQLLRSAEVREVRRAGRPGKRLSLERASIASGYTPPTVSGAMPRTPQPLKGSEERI
jgi:hypothetical protein